MERPDIARQEARLGQLAARLGQLDAHERAEFDRLDAARDLRRRRIADQLTAAHARVARLEARRAIYEGRVIPNGY